MDQVDIVTHVYGKDQSGQKLQKKRKERRRFEVAKGATEWQDLLGERTAKKVAGRAHGKKSCYGSAGYQSMAVCLCERTGPVRSHSLAGTFADVCVGTGA